MNLLDSVRAKLGLVDAMRVRNAERATGETVTERPSSRAVSSITGDERARRNRRRSIQRASRRANRGR
jgi:hypothetical protein